jgi:adenylate cyclase
MNYETDELFEYIIDAIKEGKDIPTIEELTWSKYGTEVAVLSIDSTGFTQATKERGIVHSLANLCMMYIALRPIFEEHGAISFRLDADNLFSRFGAVDQALAASIAANQALHILDIEIAANRSLGICTGIGYGYLLESSHKGAYGTEMNLASKLGEDIAGDSEILLTTAAYNQLTHPHGCEFDACSTSIAGVNIPYYRTEIKAVAP